MADVPLRPTPTRLYLVSPAASRPACRVCSQPLAGPPHHTLCRPCWHWQQHARATAMAVRYFRGEMRP